MNTLPFASRLVTVSLRVYARMLSFYPRRFRDEYGPHMLQVFGDCLRKTSERGGPAAVFVLWGNILIDYCKTLLEEHLEGMTDMNQTKFIRLSGWALMLGGLAVMLGWLASSRPEYDRFNAASLEIDRFANAAAYPLIILGILLVSVGIFGLSLRYGKASGAFGRYSLALGALSGVVSAIGAVGLSISDSNPWWSMFFFGMTAQYLGLALFGVAALRLRPMPRWNGLPILAGAFIPLFVLVTLVVEQTRGGWVEWPEAVFIAIWMLSLAGLAGLGLVLQSDPEARASGGGLSRAA